MLDKTGIRPARCTDKNFFAHISTKSPRRRKANSIKASAARFSICREPNRKYFHSAGWSSLVARQAHNLKVAGSNPAPATNFLEDCCVSSFSFVPKRRLPCTNGKARVCSASPKLIQRSSVVERSAVNRLVVGSNPTSGATSMFWVYVLENAKGQFYIGQTNNLKNRISNHNRSDKALGKFTRKNGPWRLVWSAGRSCIRYAARARN